MGKIVRTQAGSYITPASAGSPISSQGDVLDLLALCAEVGTNKLLFPAGSMADKFFDLSSGLAGEISLKLSTYRIKTAFVVDLDLVPSQRFREWAAECNRGNEILFSADLYKAERWLLTP
jgi:PadR family transcriptional regulator, regulatory protein AphA